LDVDVIFIKNSDCDENGTSAAHISCI